MERLTLGAMQFTAVALMTPTQFLLQQSKKKAELDYNINNNIIIV